MPEFNHKVFHTPRVLEKSIRAKILKIVRGSEKRFTLVAIRHLPESIEARMSRLKMAMDWAFSSLILEKPMEWRSSSLLLKQGRIQWLAGLAAAGLGLCG
jgi:hypothetical protein